jgi:protein tyrosine/serine phosphatase
MSEKPKRPLYRRLTLWTLLVLAVPVLGFGGFFVYRYVYLSNFDFVVPGKVYRSAQPSPDQVARWVEKYGLKTIVNLRHDASERGLPQETAAAEAAGATVINIRLSDRELPDPADMLRLAEVLETAPQPILLHCKMGADRAGVASVMARMAVGDKSYDRAREMLDIKFLHVDNDPQHIGGVMQQYEQWCHDHQKATGGWKEFRAWLITDYRGRPLP